MKQYKFTAKGPALNQTDLDVLQAFLSNVFRKANGVLTSRMSVQEVCDAMGVSKGGGQSKAIAESLDRLAGNIIDYDSPVVHLKGSLIHLSDSEKEYKNFCITINEDFYKLFFDASDFTFYNVNFRNSLKRPLTKWLYLFLSSHSNVFSFSHRELCRLSGSEAHHFDDGKGQFAPTASRTNRPFFDRKHTCDFGQSKGDFVWVNRLDSG